MLLILAYTYKGGVKTIIWTDTLQTTFMLLSLVLSVYLIADHLGIESITSAVANDEHAVIFNWDWKSGYFFPKAFLGGMFVAITMTGMDQEMMQKNISVRTIGESQKNMITFSFVMVIVNLLFLCVGVLICSYVAADPELHQSIADGKMVTDELFPTIALGKLGTVCGLFFIIGLISAAYPSADGALTALTASFCIDFLGFNKKEKGWTEQQQVRTRKMVHVGFAVLLYVTLLILKAVSDKAIIDLILFLASITYGPLLGLFAFGILNKTRTVSGWPVVVICLCAPAVSYLLNYFAKQGTFGGYMFGNELLIINGALVFFGLWLISKPNPVHE